ncbi:MAG: hypothetical protein NVS9B15_03300 [Acidobacteriaceae bacterium]
MRDFTLPRLYPILDRAWFASTDDLLRVARLWMDAELWTIQYRHKGGSARQSLAEAREIVRVAYSAGRRDRLTLIMNDRADLCLAADFDGVHVGQQDLSPAAARRVVGEKRVVGVSCHNERQIEEAAETEADYLAIGPVFATSSKQDADPVVGLERLHAVRKLTSKPLVAIGGVTRENAKSLWDAGADSVAVISDLLRDPKLDLQAWTALLTSAL